MNYSRATAILGAALLLLSMGSDGTCDPQEDYFFGVPSTERTEPEDGTDGGDSGTTPIDDDSDGLANEVEELFDMPPRLADADFDGYGDGIEFVGNGGDPLNGSVIPTSLNRSRIITNVTELGAELDSDQDGLGNTFELLNSLDPNDPDGDNDGYQDGLELVAGSNPFDSDSRPVRSTPPTSDGVDRPGTPPDDSDRDGMANQLESLNGTDVFDRDSDDDGYSDSIEFLMGSNPLENFSVPNFTVPDPPADDEETVVEEGVIDEIL